MEEMMNRVINRNSTSTEQVFEELTNNLKDSDCGRDGGENWDKSVPGSSPVHTMSNSPFFTTRSLQIGWKF